MSNDNNLPAIAVADMERLGALFESSGMFGASQKGQGLIVVMTCLSEKISPLAFLKTYHIIEGRPAMRADAMLARFIARGGTYEILEASDKRAAATFKTESQPTGITREYTWADAVREELPYRKHNGKVTAELKDNWRKTPGAMLWARLVSKSIRLLDPGVNAGVYTPEEISDFTEARAEHVPTPKPIAPAAIAAEMTKAEVTYPAPTAAAPALPEPAKQATPAAAAPVAEKPVTGTAEPDYSVCPTPGPNRGKAWTDFPLESLQLTVKTPGIPPGYVAAIEAAIAAKGGK